MKLNVSVKVISILIICSIYLAPFYNTTLYFYDEGLVITPAYLICQGKIPYRDFWFLHGPAQLYLTALLFRLFGFGILVGRILGFISILCVVAACFLLLNRLLSSRWLVWWGSIIVLLWSGKNGIEGSRPIPWITGLAIALIAILFFMRALEKTAGLYFFLSGCFGGAAFLFRQDMGLYFLFAIFFLWVADSLIYRYRGDSKILPLRSACLSAIGFILFTLPLLFLAIRYTGFSVLIKDLFIYPLIVFPKVRSLPCPQLIQVVLESASMKGFHWHAATRIVEVFTLFYLYRIVLFLFVVWFIVHLIRNAWDAFSAQCAILFLFVAMAVNEVALRADEMHGYYVVAMPMMLTILLIDILWARIKKENQSGHRFWMPKMVVILFLAILTVKPAGDWLLETPKRLRFVPLETPGCKNIKVRSKQDPKAMQDLVATIQNYTRPSEMIYVGLTTHKRVFVSDPLIYFLAKRLPGTYYYQLEPGSADTPVVQDRIIADLEKNKVNLLVLNKEFEEELEPNLSSVPGSPKLDDYIAEKFYPVKQIETYIILLRKGAK